MSTTATETDRELLWRFVRRGDEQAFASIVHRYGGMVHGVCQRVLHDPHAAEDAFQAVFLVLARSARRIKKRTALASWLHGVAYRVALRALAQRQRRRERTSDMDQMTAHPPIRDVGEAYEQQLLDDELEHLPPKYREPLVLHYLQGLTNNQVAHRLGLSVTAVEGRIKRGKKELRLRMTRRGVELGAVVVALQVTQSAAQSAAVQAIIPGTIKAALAAAHGATGAMSANALGLAGKEISMLTTTKLAGVLATTAAAILILGAALGSGHSFADGDAPSAADAVDTTLTAVEGASGSADAAGIGAGGAAGLPARSAQRQARLEIEKALDRPTDLEFEGNPLRDVLQYLAELHQLLILIDENALSNAGLSPDEEVSLVISGVSVRNALELVLENVAGTQLDYVIRNEVMTITTRDAADRLLETVIYPIRDLVQYGWDEPSVAQIIQRTVHPASWARISIIGAAGSGDGYMMMEGAYGGYDAGGYGEMDMYGGEMGAPGSRELGEMQIDRQQSQGLGTIETVPGALVVNQSQRVHRAVADLIRQLQGQIADSPRPETPAAASGATPQTDPLRPSVSLHGMVRVRGNVPPQPPLLQPGSDQDGTGILTKPIPDESLLVAANGGLANAFVYVRNPPDAPMPPLIGEVLLKSVGLQFVPHAVSIRTGQPLRMTNADPVVNGVHTFPVANTSVNHLLAPRTRLGRKTVFSEPEPVPVSIKDDLHPWRSAWVLPLDHPFVAITDEEGRFEIPGLPAGEVELIVWHERAGYVERNLKVDLQPNADENELLIEVDAADLQR